MKNKIKNIFLTLQKQDPQPKTELEYPNNFCLLIAIILSAQATDKMVNKATKELFKIADSPIKMLDLGLNNLKKYINIIGLFNSKANNIIKLCEILINNEDCEIPKDFDKLIKLPGVGRKTAAVFLNCAFNLPIIGVDTHIFRVANRLGIIKAKNVLEAEKQVNEKIPAKFKIHAHHWLILHGRYVCKARKPDCNNCRITNFCNTYLQNNVSKNKIPK